MTDRARIEWPLKFRRLLASFLGLLALVSVLSRPCAYAQSSAPEETPSQVRLLLELLAEPSVRDWLEKHRTAETPRPDQSAPDMMSPNYFATRTDALRQNVDALVAALPRIPEEIGRVSGILAQEFDEQGWVQLLLQIMAIVALGLGAEWVLRRATVRPRDAIGAAPAEAARGRLRASVTRLALGAGSLAAFSLVSLAAFLAFAWPPHVRMIVIGYLVAFIALRLAIVIFRFLLAPGDRQLGSEPRYRIIPMSDHAARFWHVRLSAFVGWFAFGFMTLKLLEILGVELDVRRVIAYAMGLGLLLIGLEVAWRRPNPEGDEITVRSNGRGRSNWLLSIYFVVIWLLWILAAPPKPLFWLVVIAGALPLAMGATRRAVNYVLRPPGATDVPSQMRSLVAVVVERGISAGLIVVAVVFLAGKFGIDIIGMTAHDTLATRLLRGTLSAVLIVLVADVAWQLLKVVTDRKLVDTAGSDPLDIDEVRRRQRLKTLLPIFRNAILITLIVIVVLTVLSAFGVEIGPLIAGAGVVGVAIGFGAQTLVKDIISGMFYLMDDAFRIGEYIQSDKFKGTVESFSLRSIKLRHHRGYLYTVPFGELGAIQNMSRDWVIDKLTIGVTYDSDLDKAKKLIKEIGRELSKDPDLGPNIIEPLKMQGVEQFGDYAVQIRLKVKTKPGEQFAIRRRAYALIKKGFDANGIKFAFPTVSVAGGDEVSPAMAKQALELVKSPPART